MLTMWAMGMLALLGTTPQAQRTVAVVAENAKHEVVTDLAPTDLAVVEDGVARTVTSVKKDDRPLTLAVVLDTSAVFETSFRQDMLEPLILFLAGLPAGTQFAVWTTGDRPTKLVDYTDDAAAAAPVLRRVFPQGGSTLFDTIDDALESLSDREGGRSEMVIVTGNGVEFSSQTRPLAARDPDMVRNTRVEAILVDLGALARVSNPQERLTPTERLAEYERTLSGLAERSGGFYNRILSTMGVASALKGVTERLRGALLLTYASDSQVRRPKLEVKVARPGIRVLVGAPLIDR